MPIAVTGASGQLGRRVAELLLDHVDPSEVVLVTRRPEALADLARRGADVRRGDFDQPSSLTGAFADVERLLLISTDVIGARVPQHRAAIAAARAVGVRHIVYTSLPKPAAENPAVVAHEHRATEEAVRDSGAAWTFLRNNLYAEHQIPTVDRALATGRLVTNAGDGLTAFVSREDCAAAAAAVLSGEGHEDRVYDITGPEAVSQDELGALAAELGGAPVEVVYVDDEAVVAGMVADGLPEELARALASFATATREGWLAHVSTAVEELTGRPPTSLREVLSRAQQTA